ncbi:uncharacterized protein BO66DRAFT_175066 [Aspergillus aculeatinus CBS 121060]|uniref:Uncharacterized protein n=1 Tax=Aspergillus aculeatinus CBS 121060 TaxID=1448322 RepID=A0ACD1HKA5_9EURO|nr:hypothetical protein BO66DRAFT_175066 [Aspergillus aculeatinus CBS 121060]RAH73876.1 hypothetical protein BO66DRAFT_175066 [Aspergillus aculeatinus CBS 121060]
MRIVDKIHKLVTARICNFSSSFFFLSLFAGCDDSLEITSARPSAGSHSNQISDATVVSYRILWLHTHQSDNEP